MKGRAFERVNCMESARHLFVRMFGDAVEEPAHGGGRRVVPLKRTITLRNGRVGDVSRLGLTANMNVSTSSRMSSSLSTSPFAEASMSRSRNANLRSRDMQMSQLKRRGGILNVRNAQLLGESSPALDFESVWLLLSLSILRRSRITFSRETANAVNGDPLSRHSLLYLVREVVQYFHAAPILSAQRAQTEYEVVLEPRADAPLHRDLHNPAPSEAVLISSGNAF